MRAANFANDANGEILPGTLEMLILRTLANGQLNGADIATSIHDVSEGALSVKEGALYPALHRLQKRGFVHSEAGLSRNKRRAKFYNLTPSGIKELEEQRTRWSYLTNGIKRVMENPLSETGKAPVPSEDEF